MLTIIIIDYKLPINNHIKLTLILGISYNYLGNHITNHISIPLGMILEKNFSGKRPSTTWQLLETCSLQPGRLPELMSRLLNQDVDVHGRVYVCMSVCLYVCTWLQSTQTNYNIPYTVWNNTKQAYYYTTNTAEYCGLLPSIVAKLIVGQRLVRATRSPWCRWA